MEPLVHPSELSVWHRFMQARRLHKETSRSKNKDWYRSALNLECQLHLFLEEESITEARLMMVTMNGKEAERTWQKVPVPPLSGEQEGELAEYFEELNKVLKSKKARSLGVVLHLADEFATSELAPMHERPENLNELRDLLIFDPQRVLQDHSASIDEISYRLFPNPGNESLSMLGAAITISRRYHEFLLRFRQVGENAKFPIRTIALSAPLVALSQLPVMMPEVPKGPFCLALTYSSFTVLAFFKRGGELVMLRTVRHHFGGIPPNVSNTIQTMAVALELGELEVFLLSLSRTHQLSGVEGIPGLTQSTMIAWQDIPGMNSEIPLEFQAGIQKPEKPAEGEEKQGLYAAETFQEFETGAWAMQDFLPATPEEEDLYPSQVEMQALRFGSIGLKAGGVILILLLAWTGIRGFAILRDQAWHVNDSDQLTNTNQILDTKIKRFEGWNSLLADRSKAWVNMELLNRLFPNYRSVVLTNANYTSRPENIPNQDTLGLIREWSIKGFANEQALGHLNHLNTRDGIKEVFERIYEVTGAEPLRTDLASRNLLVNLVASENKRYDPDKGATADFQFPFQFDLKITQRITQDDPIAIPTASIE